MPVKVADLARLGRLQRALARKGHKADADALERLLLTVQDHFAHDDRGHSTADLPPPAFTVSVQSNYNGGSRLVRFADRGRLGSLKGVPTGMYEGRELHYGVFACYPVHDGGPLLEAEPEPEVRPPWPFPVSAHQEAA